MVAQPAATTDTMRNQSDHKRPHWGNHRKYYSDICHLTYSLFHFCLLSLDLKRTGLANGSIRHRQPFSRRTSQPSLGYEITMILTFSLSTHPIALHIQICKSPRRGQTGNGKKRHGFPHAPKVPLSTPLTLRKHVRGE